jgi:hypothetical protein
MRRTEFGRGGKSSFGQASERFIAAFSAFEDFTRDMSARHMLLSATGESFTCPSESYFHVAKVRVSKLSTIVVGWFRCSFETRRPSITL